jgi:hypothetical protein
MLRLLCLFAFLPYLLVDSTTFVFANMTRLVDKPSIKKGGFNNGEKTKSPIPPSMGMCTRSLIPQKAHAEALVCCSPAINSYHRENKFLMIYTC